MKKVKLTLLFKIAKDPVVESNHINNVELEECKPEHDILSMTRRNVSPISGNGLSNIPPSQTSSSKIEAENAMRSTTRNRSV